MIELGSLPLRGGVADRAVFRKTRGHVAGIRGCLKGWTMTCNALCTGPRKRVPGMALRAVDVDVGSGQRESGSAVIKLGSLPLCGGMANGAVLREVGCNMIGIRGCLKGWTMTSNALRTGSRKRVPGMALRTVDVDMSAGQRESGSAVIKLGSLPLCGGMANGAVLREAGCNMIGVDGCLKGLPVTRDALRAGSRKRVAGVTLRTVDSDVGSRQRESGSAVIKLGSLPLLGGVAGLAIRRNSGGNVIRIGGGAKCAFMAAHAVCGNASKLSTDMALRTGDADVSSRQCKAAVTMIEFRSLPSRRGVAAFASRRKVCPPVIRVCRFFVEPGMATHTSGGCPGKASGDMARAAVDTSMGAREGKTRARRVVKAAA